jgi:hypothetical protein
MAYIIANTFIFSAESDLRQAFYRNVLTDLQYFKDNDTTGRLARPHPKREKKEKTYINELQMELSTSNTSRKRSCQSPLQRDWHQSYFM